MILNQEIKRGDIFYCDLSPGVGSEYQGMRPVLIVQNNIGNKYSTTVTVIPVTSVMSKRKLPTHVHIDGNNFGLTKESIVTCEALRTVDKARFTSKIGSVDNNTLLQVENAIMINLGLIS